MTLVWSLFHAYIATLTVAVLAVGLCDTWIVTCAGQILLCAMTN